MKKETQDKVIDIEEYNRIEENYKKIKKVNKWLIFIIVLGVFGVIGLFELYLHRSVLEKVEFAKKISSYKNEYIAKFNTTYEYVEQNHNAAYKFELDCQDGSNQAYHPKILNFKEKWNGYKYWMTYSPYPDGNDKYENPHIMASNDLINWEVPKGLKNPIENTPKNYIHENIYNSDPHILYNDDTDTMELYFRYVNDEKDQMILYKKTSKDGINWTKKEVVFDVTRSKKDYISPALIYDNGVYKMWFVDKDRSFKYIESKDGKKWSDEKTIKLNYPIARLTTWHIDVIKTEKGYELLTVAYKNWKDRNSMNLYYFNSKDNENYSDGIIILRPSLISWDNRGIYRSSFIYEDGKYFVFYSALSTQFERGIGLSYGEHIENLIGSNIKSDKNGKK